MDDSTAEAASQLEAARRLQQQMVTGAMTTSKLYLGWGLFFLIGPLLTWPLSLLGTPISPVLIGVFSVTPWVLALFMSARYRRGHSKVKIARKQIETGRFWLAWFGWYALVLIVSRYAVVSADVSGVGLFLADFGVDVLLATPLLAAGYSLRREGR
jgi:hypothetical protein